MAREDFEIVDQKPIGRGQFGTVFRARRRGDGAIVALKLILHDADNGGGTIAAERHGAILQQEFAARHGMVPAVFEFGADGDDFYIAMELVEGPSLEERLRNGALDCDEAVGHALWLCEFLDRAHAFSATVEQQPYRLLHNDLKPAHLKIEPSGDRKVLDFGMAKVLEETRELATDVGRTIAYAAPERLRSERVNVHADFWSLGVMLYEMVSGHRPYPTLEGPRLRRHLYAAITNNAPRASLPPDCPLDLQAIIHRLLAFQPAHRYQSAADIRADLQRYTDHQTPLAAQYYDTPATLPVLSTVRLNPDSIAVHAAGVGVVGTEPVPVTGWPLPTVVAPTDPVPAAEPAATPAAVAPHVSVPAAPPRRRSRIAARWFVNAIATAALIGVVTTEGVAWLFAERFRDTIPAIDERSVTSSRAAYRGVARLALLDLGLKVRVNRPLTAALEDIGDRVVADYRREVPTMGPEEWRQAAEAFAWARVLSRRDRGLLSKQLTAEGHVRRLAAQRARPPSAALAQTALVRFRDAAASNPDAFDPYIGMAVTQLYVLGDVDGALQSLDAAVSRGYAATRRDTALLGDAYMRRAVVGRRRAALLSGDQRQGALQKTRSDLELCVSSFEQIVEFGNAAKHLESCKAQIRQVDQQLTPEEF